MVLLLELTPEASLTRLSAWYIYNSKSRRCIVPQQRACSSYRMHPRVVVTGIGCYTPLGPSLAQSWKELLRGTSGLVRLQDLAEYEGDYKPLSRLISGDLRVGKVGFEARDQELLSSQEQRRTSRAAQLAMVTAEEALRHAGLLSGSHLVASVDRNRAGCIIGAGLPSMEDISQATASLSSARRPSVSPFFIPKMLNNMAAGNVAIKFQLRGASNCPSTACASGNNAIGDAYNFIRLGYSDVIVAGASELSVHPLALAGFVKAKSISASGISRPFDARRDGFVLGEGCGLLVLESLEHARHRGAEIIAEVVGYGVCSDAHHITSPSEGGDGARRAMHMALQDAGIWDTRDQVGYVNAHATSTPLGDRAEARAIQAVFGATGTGSTLVSSNKGHMGHLLGAAGAVEAVFTVQSLREGIVPHTLNLQTVGEGLADKKDGFGGITFVQDNPVPAPLTYAMNNSFGFGGINSSLLFKKW